MAKKAKKGKPKNGRNKSKGGGGGNKRAQAPPSPLGRKGKRRGKGPRSNIGSSVNDAQLRSTLEADGTKTIVNMSADGNCLFRSISDQLYHDFGSNHANIRSDICDYLESFEEEFSFFLVLDEEEEDEDAADFESYVGTMREDGEWGGNIELVAAARLYRRNIIVFMATLDAFTIPHGEESVPSAGPDVLLSYHDNDHYNSVRDNTKGRPPPPIKTTFVKKIVKGRDSQTSSQAADPDDQVAPASSEEGKGDDGSNIHGTGNEQPEGPTPDAKAKVVKKSAPCPCGSGNKYKKCCWAKERHAARVQRLKNSNGAVDANDDDGGEQETEVEGSFRLMKI